MKVLVTGGTGFVGSWLMRELQKRGIETRLLLRRTSDLKLISDLHYEPAYGDVTDAASVMDAARDVDTVFHLAGLIGYSKQQYEAMEKVNVQGTAHVIDACLKNKVRRLVYMSSVVAIGASFDGRKPLDENSPYELDHLDLGYFQTKHRAEKLVVNACVEQGLNAVILNPSTIYGPGDAMKGSRKTQIKVAQGRLPFYTSGGVNVVHIADMIHCLMTAWEKGKPCERYIIAGENITIKQLFTYIAEAAGVPAPSIYLPDLVVRGIGKLGDVLERVGKKGPLNSENAWTSTHYHWFNSAKAQKAFDYKPRSAKEAIAASVAWMKDQGLLEKSSKEAQ